MELVVHLDTNAYSAFMRGLADAVFIIERSPRIVICPIVIGELKAGFALGRHEQRNLVELRRIMDSPRVDSPAVDDVVTDNYARIYKQLRRDGTPISANDIWIASFVGRREVIYTHDSHFEQVDGLLTVSDRARFQEILAGSS